MNQKAPRKETKSLSTKAALRPEVVPDTLREELSAELQDLINNRQVPSVVDRIVAVVSQHSYNESQLPAAHELKALEDAHIGGAKIAIQMAQREQNFIIEETKRNNKRAFLLDLLAPITGLVGLFLLILLCGFMVHKGYATQAVVAAIGIIGTVVGLFVRMNKPEGSPKSDKAPPQGATKSRKR